MTFFSFQLLIGIANTHCVALKQIVPNLSQIQRLDYDTDESYHPKPDNPCQKEWRRKNIDNYLLVSTAWKRAVATQLNEPEDSLFRDDVLTPYFNIIDRFFEEERWTLASGENWQTVKARVFSELDGKKRLFSDSDSLFNRILTQSEGLLKIGRQSVALSMKADEIHQDVYDFFEALSKTVV